MIKAETLVRVHTYNSKKGKSTFYLSYKKTDYML